MLAIESDTFNVKVGDNMIVKQEAIALVDSRLRLHRLFLNKEKGAGNKIKSS